MISESGKFSDPHSSSRENGITQHCTSQHSFSNELCGCKGRLNMQLSVLAPYLEEMCYTTFVLLPFQPFTSRESSKGNTFTGEKAI